MEAAGAAPFSCARWWLPAQLGSVAAGAAQVGGRRSSSDHLLQREVEAAGAAQLSCCSDNAVEYLIANYPLQTTAPGSRSSFSPVCTSSAAVDGFPDRRAGPGSGLAAGNVPGLPSGNRRKFRHGIYLVYTMYILIAFVILVYTRYMTGICFLKKSIFVYYGMHVCMK